MTASNGSMVSRRRLGIELRLLRERAGMSAMDAAGHLDDLSQTKISRLERGKVQRPRIGDVRALLELYGVTGGDAEGLLDLARGSRGRGWWNSYSDLLPSWFHGYVGLEAEAAELINFEPQLIPGLLQTEAYVRALARTAPGLPRRTLNARSRFGCCGRNPCGGRIRSSCGRSSTRPRSDGRSADPL